MKKILAIMLALIMVFSLAACGGGSSDGGNTDGGDEAGKTYELRISLMDDEGSVYYEGIINALNAIEERTGGGVTFNVFPNNQLGDYESVASEVMQGTIDAAICTMSGTYDNRINLATMPYVFPTYDAIRKGFAPGSYVYDLCDEIYEKQGIEFLGLMCTGLCGIGFSEYPENYGDPYADKPLTLRIPSHDTFRMMTDAMGYKSSQIAWSDIYTSMQTGVVEGYTGMQTYSSILFFSDVTKYWVDYDYCSEIMGILINKKLFDSMPEEYRTAITEEFALLAENSIDVAEKVNEDAVADWEAIGTEVIRLTDEERAAYTKKVQEEVWPKLEAEFGKEAIDALLASVSE